MRARNRNWKKPVAMMLSVILCLGMVQVSVRAEEVTTVNLEVTYGQTEARTMLGMINDFRTGGNAWAWNETNTAKNQYNNLSAITYDYELEKVAMQRAAELAVLYAHNRPNGETWSTAYPSDYSSRTRAENIAVGYTSAEKVFEGWQETDEDYSGQGHRRNMLNDAVGAIGIGHVVYKGVHFWVQEFATAPVSTTEVTAKDTKMRVPIEILSSNISGLTLKADQTNIQMSCKESVDLPSMVASFRHPSQWKNAPDVEVQTSPSWTMEDGTYASIKDGKIVAGKVGTTNLVGTSMGTKVEIPVTISHHWNNGEVTSPATCTQKGERTYTCSDCGTTKTEEIARPKTMSLSKSVYTYNGKTQRPSVTIKDGNGKVISNANYSISYVGNTKSVGIHTVKITLKGSYYSGVMSKTYVINPKGTTVSKVKGKKKGITVSWKKQGSETTGYEINYGLKSNFSGAKISRITKNKTVSKNIAKLKGKKKYYVRIRTYKKVGSKIFYSTWSKAKTVKTK